MTPKKKRKAPAAQQLIDSLLDERTPPSGLESSQRLVDRPVDTATFDHDFGSRDQGQEAQPIRETKSTELLATAAPPASSSARTIPSELAAVVTRSKNAADQITRTYNGGAGLKSVKVAVEQSPPATQQDEKTTHIEPRSPSVKKSDAPPRIPVHEATGVDISAAAQSMTEMVKPIEQSTVDRMGITELKTVAKMRDRFHDQRATPRTAPVGGGFTSPEAALKQSENLRIAQSRITELEVELERLRRDNEQLATAGETLRRRTDELLAKSEQLELQLRESERIHDEEKKVFRGQLHSKDRDNTEMRGRLEEMEIRLESNFKKIRVRERELEHRLEIVRMESQTMVATKDKMILELKRQIDQITHENDYAKQKSQEHFNQYKEKQETIRRVVRALRIALTILEGDEDGGGKKSD